MIIVAWMDIKLGVHATTPRRAWRRAVGETRGHQGCGIRVFLEYAYSWGGRFSRIAGGARIGKRAFEVGVANSGTGPARAGVPFP